VHGGISAIRRIFGYQRSKSVKSVNYRLRRLSVVQSEILQTIVLQNWLIDRCIALLTDGDNDHMKTGNITLLVYYSDMNNVFLQFYN